MSRHPLVRFLRLYRPHRGWIALSLLLASATLLAQVGLLAVSGWFIAAMGIAGVAGTTMNYFTPGAIIRGLAILRTAGRYGERLLTHDVTLRMTAQFRHWFYMALEPMPPRITEQWHSADLFSRLKADLDRLERFFLQAFLPALVSLFTVAVVTIAAVWIAPTLALGELSLLLLSGIVVPLFRHRACVQSGQRMVLAQAQLRREASEMLQGMAELRLYGMLPAQCHRIEQTSTSLIAQERHLQRADALSQGVMVGVQGCASVLGIVVCLPLVHDGTMAPALLAMVPLFCLAAFDTVAALPAAIQAIPSATLAAARVFELVDQAPPPSGTAAVPDAPCMLRCTLPVMPPRISVPVSFTLARGEVMALLGPSGIGKTSLVHALVGLLPITQSDIYMDAVSVRDADSEAWRSRFAVAEQVPAIFAGTLRENLRMAHPGAEDALLEEACKAAHFPLAEFSEGLGLAIGEHGATLSGGQVRRLALARALLKPATWLVLDEPTEGLDALQAQRIMQDILAWARVREQGVIVITHDRSLLPLLPVHYVLGRD